ncbi:MAG: dUTP diphosphatase [Actinobacteria bacterium ATB1]|nr:dUTP diphosphatase [Actinobacteria bacterium ATB1]
MYAPGELEVLYRRVGDDASPDDGIPIPGPAHPGDAGTDLRSRVKIEIRPGERVAVPTGIAIAFPPGWAGFVLPRSGLARRHGVGLVNSPGLIDPGYRGEIEVLLINHDPAESFVIERGDRIAQLVMVPVGTPTFRVVAQLPDSVRGEGGFGSSGRS